MARKVKLEVPPDRRVTAESGTNVLETCAWTVSESVRSIAVVVDGVWLEVDMEWNIYMRACVSASEDV